MLSNEPAAFRQSGFWMPLLSRLRLMPRQRATGRLAAPFPPGPLLADTPICNYNVLYQMGIPPNVAFIEETRNETYSGPEEAFASVQRMFGGFNSCEEGAPRLCARVLGLSRWPLEIFI
jgi:hypothetical protein